MKVKDLKWYSPVLFLVGAILGFADPITDILTLVKFYRTNHKTWFGVGLAFVILPCLMFPILYFAKIQNDPYSRARKCTQTILCGFHPFSVTLVRLQGFFFCIKKWWRGDEINSDDNEEADDLLGYIDWAVLIESVLESAPQFVLQLYAVSVQEEPVEVIQIISLPVSFLSLAWAFTTADQRWHRTIRDLKVKHNLALFVTHFFLLSSRLFAVCYFTVSKKWVVIGILLFHSSAIMIADAIWISCSVEGKCKDFVGFIGFALAFFLCVHWLRDDISLASRNDSTKTGQRKIQVFSHVLFVLENFVMILVYYFSQHSNTWYSLPVTVCVCLFSLLGSVLRVIHFHFLYRSK